MIVISIETIKEPMSVYETDRISLTKDGINVGRLLGFEYIEDNKIALKWEIFKEYESLFIPSKISVSTRGL